MSIRRIAIFLAVTLLAFVALAGTILFAFRTEFHLPPPDISYPHPGSTLEAQRQDLDYFSRVLAIDRSFSAAARVAAETRVAELQSLPAALPTAELHVALMQVMAMADNGHTRMQPLANEGTLLVPVRVTRFAEGFYVMRAMSPYADMLGGRLESIDGTPFDQILAKLETLRGGVEGLRRESATQYIVVQELLYGLGIARHRETSVWTVRLPDGRQIIRTLTATRSAKGQTVHSGFRWLSPEPSRGYEHDWPAYHPSSGTVPASWRDFDNHFRLSNAAEGCARIIRIQDIADTDSQKLSPFLSKTEASLKAAPACAIIVDLRGDSGGDYTKTWHFAHALPGLVAPKGRIFTLTDPNTFSAAITTAAFIKDAAGERNLIVGEPAGDRLAFFSEGGSACLPNMKVCINYQTARHDYAHPCSDWRQCYWLNWLYPVRVSSLQPDELVPLRFADWNAGHDAALERAIEIGQASR